MKAVAALVFLFGAGAAAAAPKIEAVTGPRQWDAITIISGTGFGDKSNAINIDDTFAQGINPYIANAYDLDLTTAVLRHAHARASAHLNFRSGADEGKCQGSAVVDRMWSVSYWVYLAPNWDWGTTTFSGTHKFLSNIKVFRMWSPASINENFVLATHGWENRMVYDMENITTDAKETGAFSQMRTILSLGAWHHLQFEFVENSAPKVGDGRFWAAIDGVNTHRTDIVTREDFPNLKRPMIMGWSNVWNAGENGGGGPDASDNAPNDFYMADLFVENSAQKVVVGNAPALGACTHTEWMPIAWWSDTEIRFRNRVPEDFPPPWYLFVIGPGGISGDDMSAAVLLFGEPQKPRNFRRN